MKEFKTKISKQDTDYFKELHQQRNCMLKMMAMIENKEKEIWDFMKKKYKVPKNIENLQLDHKNRTLIGYDWT